MAGIYGHTRSLIHLVALVFFSNSALKVAAVSKRRLAIEMKRNLAVIFVLASARLNAKKVEFQGRPELEQRTDIGLPEGVSPAFPESVAED
jgi:hypothetical protein